MSRANDDNQQDELEEKPNGYIKGFPVISFLRVLELDQKTCALQVQANGKNGCLFLEKGVVLDAAADGLSGEEAAISIMGWENARIQVLDAGRPGKRTIHAPLSRLAMEASRRKDESAGSNARALDLKQAILLVESNQFKKARAFFSVFLKANPEDREAWFWCSRCLGSLKAISGALARCAGKGPKTPRLLEEIRKIEQARLHIKEDRVIRCPFCWAPLNRDGIHCHFCRAGLDIATALKPEVQARVQTPLIIDAVVRYSRILVTGKNVKSLYYLCLAHCNLNQAEEALEILSAAICANPGIKLLVDHHRRIASRVSRGKTSGLTAGCAGSGL